MGADELVQRCPMCGLFLGQESYIPVHWGNIGEYCRLCRNAYTREWRMKNHEKTKSLQRRSYHKAKAKDPLINRRRRLKSKYGLSLDDLECMLKGQNNRCLGCSREFNNADVLVNVDHNHKTNKVRGLLCTPCNQALGLVDDSQDILTNLIKYLEKYEKV